MLAYYHERYGLQDGGDFLRRTIPSPSVFPFDHGTFPAVSLYTSISWDFLPATTKLQLPLFEVATPAPIFWTRLDPGKRVVQSILVGGGGVYSFVPLSSKRAAQH